MTIDKVDYIGAGLLIGGILAVYEFYHRLKKGIKTTGVVIENKDDWSFSGTTLKKHYTPLIRIKINNEIKELKLNASTNIPIYKVGEKVKKLFIT
jgi:hypothetical protein